MHFVRIGATDGPVVVFAHGWGRSHRDFIPVAEALAPMCQSILLDLPGFGASVRPKQIWGTKDYAQYCAKFIQQLNAGPVIWVGHSFGGRIGLRLASAHSKILRATVLVASAGIPRTRSLLEQIKGKIRANQFKIAKMFVRSEAARIALEKQFGSTDYVQSRETGMRDIFLATINEDQTKDVKHIKVPMALIYGEVDKETPPEIGMRLNRLIKQSYYLECEGLDHLGVLDRGRHQIALAVKQFALTQGLGK